MGREDATMSGPLKVDTHLHMYPSRAEGEWWKTGYEIWEYGEGSVQWSADVGTLEETTAALDRGGFAHGVVLNLFAAGPFRQQYESTLPPDMDATARVRALAEFDATTGERYIAFNRWLMDTLADVPARDGVPFAEVPAFAPMLREFRGLTVVLAHLGGGKWRETLAVAEAFPHVAFDLCEIIEWAGAPGAPTAAELATLIRAIGPDRVVLGSDYPWYEPARTAELVDSLPVLSRAERDAILGENAARILRLPV
jgi:predicted TIM-barrel fold metal-dependent hydrolase